MKKLFDLKNVNYVGKRSYQTVSGEAKLQTAVLVDLDTARWNELAKKTNTRSFIRMTGKQPSSYAEVQEWMKNLIEDTKKAPAVTGAVQYA